MLALLIGTASASNTGPIEEKWNITFDGQDDDHIASIIKSNSEGYIVSGNMGLDPISSDQDGFLYEIDSEGEILWREKFGGNQRDSLSAVFQADKQNYIAVGNTISFGSPSTRSTWIIKVDNDGNEIWNKTILQDVSTIISSGQKTSDGGFVLAGMRAPLRTAGGNLVGLLIKTDSEGNVEWSKDFGTGQVRTYDCFYSVRQTPEGNYILSGTTQSFSSGNVEDGWLVKVDSNGNELWNKSFGGKEVDFLDSVIVSPDGDYIALGRSKQYGESLFNAWAVRTDKNGNLLWEKRYFDHSDSYFSSIEKSPDENYLVTGSVGKVPNGSVQASFSAKSYEAVLMKIDGDGNSLWSENFDGYQTSSFSSIAVDDDSYVVAGSAKLNDSGNSDGLIVTFNEPAMVKQSASGEDTSESQPNQEKSPLSVTLAAICLAVAFIFAKRP
ncbi:hypothetical protein EFE41_09770 [Methanohalophilus portucalensis FDF-1]|uniref:Uncharacterized protein n=2 Tax=Methanohalophilus portucalensis TaxID=39664 RepID=A0A3M9L6Y6_9EURY|nr:hypothetical protein BKM01_02025 [Methanohalophilus portucalensis]RNI08785.1 hypothetical protein EFE41_09770 [Methanohalophilus portucalensis FDF-1]